MKALPAPGGSPGTSGVAIAIIEQPALPAELTTTLELAADFARASKAKATNAHVVVSEQARRADLLPGAKKAG